MTVKGLRLVEIRQSSEAPTIADVSLAVREQVRKLLPRRNLPRGSRVAITAGSRGIRGAVESIEDAALEQLHVLGGLAVVKNARERTASVEGFGYEDFLIRTTVKSLSKEPGDERSSPSASAFILQNARNILRARQGARAFRGFERPIRRPYSRHVRVRPG
jgi:hypothetical protein